MRAGRLNRKITIQRKSTPQDKSGQEVKTWASITHRRSASVQSVSGGERFVASQVVARQQVEFHIRWSGSVANVSPLDRVLYPSPEDANEQSPVTDTIFDVTDVQELGFRDGLKIVAVRRSEHTA